MQQDQSEASSSSKNKTGSCCGGAGGGSVASRLKKMINNGKSSNNGESLMNNGAKKDEEENLTLNLTTFDKEVIRILGQHLRNIGMIETVETLVKESGVRLEHPNASKFRHNVLAGAWESVLKDLDSLSSLLDKSSTNVDPCTTMKFLVLEQKYLECLEKGRVVEALNVLRNELTPLQFNVDRVHALSTYLMINNSSDLKKAAEWEGSSHKARCNLMDKLQTFLPATVMLQPRRLEILLSQALENQKEKCILHNTYEKINLTTQSLLTDHFCDRSNFPCETWQILSDHCDEVLYCQFSNDGRFLATGSKDTRVLIWRLTIDEPGNFDDEGATLPKRWVKRAALEGHSLGVAFFVWSPDDRHLLVVGPEEGPDLWLWDMQKYELKVRVAHDPQDALIAAAWFPDGKKFTCGGPKGHFYVCDLEGAVVESCDSVRVKCMAVRSDNQTILTADTHNRIRAYTFTDEAKDETLVREEHSLMYFTLSKDDRYALCNIKDQGLHLWDLKNKCIVKRFRGLVQGYFAVYSCFGGVDENFVASGSEGVRNANGTEDFHVYVWRRDGQSSSEEPVLILKGHHNVVNAVAWNPTDPSIMASCSDDGTVRIWGPPRRPTGSNYEEMNTD